MAAVSRSTSFNEAGPSTLEPTLRRAILRTFTRKYGLQLHASALGFIRLSLQRHELLEHEEEWEDALEALAGGVADIEGGAPSIVTRETLEAVYERLVVADTAVSKGNSSLGGGGHDLTSGEVADPEKHFNIIDVFNMPRIVWKGKAWETLSGPTVLPVAASKPAYLAYRLALLRSVVSRNENFLPPLAVSAGRARDAFMKLTSTKNLLGRQGQRFLLFGMLCTTEDGRYALEDADGTIPGEGIFTEGSMILVEGEYTEEERVRAFAIGHPPSESRKVARQLCAQNDFLGTGAISLQEEKLLRAHEEAHDELSFVFISDLHLDHTKTMNSFRAMLQGFTDADFLPFAFVLCGNFSANPHASDAIRRYQAMFAQLGDLLLTFPSILRASHFIFLSGPADPFVTPLLPRVPLPTLISQRLKARVGNAAAQRMHFTSNPARLQYFGQEIVVCRDDLMGRMLRNTVRLKEEARDVDLKKYLVSTILDQANLCPLPQQARPVLWEHDHALRLYPMPTALVLADKFDRYELTYEGCHVFNPSSFRGSSYGWTTYYPATGKAERSELPQA